MLRHKIYDAPLPDVHLMPLTELRMRSCGTPASSTRRRFGIVDDHGIMRRPDEVHADPLVVGCTRETLQSFGSGPAMIQPTRAELLAALAG